MKNGAQAVKAAKERSYVSQSDVPSVTLERAIVVPTAIGENYGFKPTTPLQVAKALDLQPGASNFRMLTGAAIAFGLTEGGYNAEMISITPLGMRIVRPLKEGDDVIARREAFLRPRVVREFLQKYDGAPLPKENIAQNVLIDFGVPQERTADVLGLILEGAGSLGLLQEIKDRKYVDLSGAKASSADGSGVSDGKVPTDTAVELEPPAPTSPTLQPSVSSKPIVASDPRSRRVFITHGKNNALIEPIKKLLAFGELQAVVSVQTQTVSQPVPGKVMEEMRSCGAAIIHVEDERHLVDAEGNEHVVLNDNVLIEIGAAMALYGQRFILVVKDGVRLPSNLQGLLELRYKGNTLDVNDTVNLMEAINDMKKRPLP